MPCMAEWVNVQTSARGSTYTRRSSFLILEHSLKFSNVLWKALLFKKKKKGSFITLPVGAGEVFLDSSQRVTNGERN